MWIAKLLWGLPLIAAAFGPALNRTRFAAYLREEIAPVWIVWVLGLSFVIWGVGEWLHS